MSAKRISLATRCGSRNACLTWRNVTTFMQIYGWKKQVLDNAAHELGMSPNARLGPAQRAVSGEPGMLGVALGCSERQSRAV